MNLPRADQPQWAPWLNPVRFAGLICLLLLGAMGIYFLAWRWSSSRFGAALAATAYIFNGVTFSCLGWPNYLVALGWMPWVLLTTERAWSLGGRSIIIAAMLAGLQLLSGV